MRYIVYVVYFMINDHVRNMKMRLNNNNNKRSNRVKPVATHTMKALAHHLYIIAINVCLFITGAFVVASS